MTITIGSNSYNSKISINMGDAIHIFNIKAYNLGQDKDDLIVKAFTMVDSVTDKIQPFIDTAFDLVAMDFENVTKDGSAVISTLFNTLADVGDEITNTVGAVSNAIVNTKDTTKNDSVFQQLKDRIKKETEEVDAVITNKTAPVFQIHLPITSLPNDSLQHSYSTNEVSTGEFVNARMPLMLARTFKSTKPIVDVLESNLNRMINIASRKNFTFNTNPVTAFNNTEPRQITFNFILIPNNESEATKIFDTIKILQYLSAGVRMGLKNTVLKMPYIFKFDFNNVEISEIINFVTEGLWFITNVSVHLGTEGTINMFTDGHPKKIQLSVTFLERKPLYIQELVKNAK